MQPSSSLPKFSFEKANPNTHTLIQEWLHRPHVQPYFYGIGLQNTLKNVALFVEGKTNNGLYSFTHWVGYAEDEPFAFLMTSPITGPHDANDPYNEWYDPETPTITLDLLIGEPTYLGKGLSAPMIRSFLDQHAGDVKRVIIDPAQDNPRAVHVYEKAGFKKVKAFKPSFDPEKPHWMMCMDLDLST